MVKPWFRGGVVAAWVSVGCGPQVQPSTATAADGGSGSSGAASGSGAGSTVAMTGDEPEVTTADPPEIFDVGTPPDEPPSGCLVELPASCQREWTDDEFLATGDDVSIEVSDDGLRVFVGAEPPQADEVWTLEFNVPCPRTLGAPKLDQTQFEVPAIVGISVAAKFEYSLVGRYSAWVDVEHVDGCAQLLVHEISVEPEPLEPAGAPLFSWDDLLRTGYLAD